MMKRFALVILAMTLLLPLMWATEMLTLKDNNDTNLTLDFSLGAYNFRPDNANQPVILPNAGDDATLNNYQLPVLTKLLQVPASKRAEIQLTNPRYTYFEQVSLSPTDAEIACSPEAAQLSEPFVMRNNLLATLAVQPFIYNPDTKTLKVLLSAELVISFVPDSRFALSRELRQTKEYKEQLSRTVLNYRDTSRTGEANGSLLIIYNPTASPLTVVQPLITWKHQKGWEVHAVSTTTTGNSTTGIKNYIQTAYDTWNNPPEYVLLLGRAMQTNSVPTYTEHYNYNTVGDYKYVLLEGDDIIPDAYIGRLTFTTSEQLTTMINKIISYEKKQGLATTDWFGSMLLVSDESQSGPSCSTNIDYVQDLMQSYDPALQYTYVNSGSFPTQITTALSQGASNFHYRGHNGYSGLTNTDASGLNNVGKFPFISFITCFSGNFGSQTSTSIGESFIRSGTTTSPRGGIGFIGSSCETHTCLNNVMEGAIAYGFYQEGLTSQGQVLNRAKLALLANYPQYPDDYINQNFQSLNLIGDPSVDIWLRNPTDISVSYSPTAGLANGTLHVRVTDLNGNPIAGAKLCLLNGSDEVFLVGYTNDEGVYVFSWATATAGTATLTVSKPNHSTYQGSVSFAAQTNGFAFANQTAYSQLCSGGSYTLPIAIINNLYPDLTNVTGVFASETEFAEVSMGNLSFGNMAVGQTISAQQNVQLSLSQHCPQGAPLNFVLFLQGTNNAATVSDTLYFQVSEAGPSLSISNVQIGTDNVLTPGETSNVYITLQNNGTATATAVSATLSSVHPEITISQNVQPYSNISTGNSSSNSTPFGITASQNLYIGTVFSLKLIVNYNDGASQELSKTFTLGNVTSSAMTGPDAYGYICVAGTDNHPLAHPYSWMELNPALGGNGTLLNLTDSDTEGSGTYSTLNLAFPFRYYGVTYNQVTVCSNGFIMPGSAGSQEWMNWEIPGPMVPRPIIAPFWDDLLIDASSKILYSYDEPNHRTIIEWYNLRNKYDFSQLETFEVILYDHQAVQTPTGDNAFLFQYKVFNNVDAGNYGVSYVDHGQYASVGIADHTGLVGIGYTFQDTYPSSAVALANFTTLYFSTIPSYGSLPNPSVQNWTINENIAVFANNQIDCGETISLLPTVLNGSFTDLEASSVTLSTSDPYANIIANSSTLPLVNPGATIAVQSPFIIQISADCPNLHNAVLHLVITAGTESYATDFSILIHAPQVQIAGLTLNNAEIYFLAQDYTSTLSMQISNLSNIELTNGVFTFADNAFWTASPAQLSFPLQPNATSSVSVDIHINANAPIGETIQIAGNYSIPGIYDSLYVITVLVGSPDLMLSQDFDLANGFADWQLYSGVSVQPAEYISQAGYEVVVSPTAGNHTYYLTSPLFLGYDIQLMQISFAHFNLHPNALNTLQISYNSGSSWINVFSFNALDDVPTSSQINLSNVPANTRFVKLRWKFTVSGTSTNQIFMDNIRITAIHHAVGYLNGTVSLECQPNLVNQVNIYSPWQPANAVHPDATGQYSLPLYQGSYDIVRAELDGYLSAELQSVSISSGITISDSDFTLAYLQKPVNLSYIIQENQLLLNWELQTLPGRTIPDYYQVYILHQGQTWTDTTSVQNYIYSLEVGAYQAFTKSVYLSDGVPVYSDSSNTVALIYTGNDEHSLIPAVFALQQNYPNPFNPSTLIHYSLSKSGQTNLCIYNMKGELIRKLIDTPMPAGYHSIRFDGKDMQGKPLGSGTYFYRLNSAEQKITRKMVLMK